MSIVFYSMGSRCGFCVRAEQMLKDQIESGEVVVLEASKANGKFTGFPSFENKSNGKTHTGLPSSVVELYKKLGVSHSRENYCPHCGKVKENMNMSNSVKVEPPRVVKSIHNNMVGVGVL